MIKVRLYATLAEESRSRKKEIELPGDASLTVMDVVKKELPAGWDEFVMAIVNGRQAELEQDLKDGDLVELMLATVGG